MIEGIFTALYNAMSGAGIFAVLASFAWGILSILLSPCHLSSIPLVVGFISSQGKISVGRTFNISLIFSIGILITIALIGIITASLGRLIGDIGSTGNYLVAGIFFLVGLYLLGIIKINWNTIGIRKTKDYGFTGCLYSGTAFRTGIRTLHIRVYGTGTWSCFPDSTNKLFTGCYFPAGLRDRSLFGYRWCRNVNRKSPEVFKLVRRFKNYFVDRKNLRIISYSRRLLFNIYCSVTPL